MTTYGETNWLIDTSTPNSPDFNPNYKYGHNFHSSPHANSITEKYGSLLECTRCSAEYYMSFHEGNDISEYSEFQIFMKANECLSDDELVIKRLLE